MHHKFLAYFPLAALPLAVSVLLSGCGGGGGGSQSPGNSTPIPTQTLVPITSGTGVYNPSDPSNVGAARARGITGTGVKVGVVDTDFNLADPELAGRITKSVYTQGSGSGSSGFFGASGNGDPHGTDVAEALGGLKSGVAPGVQIQGVAAGTPSDQVALSSTIYNFLYNNGVRIVNQSNGVGSITATNGAAAYSSIYQPFVAKGALFIWATGNGSASQPTLTAGLPALYPDLQRGWLAVTAINAVGGTQAFSTADTVPGVLSSYANACGVAANWCLAAAGDFVSPNAGSRLYGTSFAAPAVTGAVAMVQQVYPWMNADLLRQTILSTTSSMGNTAIYGWGLLNASKAVNGPALFAQSLALGPTVNVTFDTITSTFSNAIAGDAGLIKGGTGTLTLSGVNSYSGSNEIVAGTLNVTGRITSLVQIDAGGNLSGSGGIVANNVTNNGRLSNTGNGLSIVGNYTATQNAILANDINARLSVSGTAALGGSHFVATVPAGNADANAYVTSQANGMPQRVVVAGAVVNTFSDVGFQTVGAAFPPMLTAQITYTTKEVDLTIGRNATSAAVQSISPNPTTTNSAANVEQAMTVVDTMVASGQTGGTNTAMIASATALERVPTVAALAATLDSLSGQIHASAQGLIFQQSQAVNRALSNRLSQLGIQDKQVKAGVWGNLIGASGKLTESGYAGASTSMAGGEFGIDAEVNDRSLIGAAISYSDSQASFDRSGGNSRSQNTGISLYGRVALSDQHISDAKDLKSDSGNALAGGAYVAGRAGVASITSTVSRTADLGTETEHLSANHKDTMYSAYVESGFAYKLASINVLTPFIGASYDRLQRGGFAESGGSFGLIANSHSYQQTAAVVGVRAEVEVDWFVGKSTIQAYAAWQHALSTGNLNITAAFSGAPGSNFTVQGIGLSRNSGWSGVGISTSIYRNLLWLTNFDGQFGRGGLVNSVFSVGLHYAFN